VPSKKATAGFPDFCLKTKKPIVSRWPAYPNTDIDLFNNYRKIEHLKNSMVYTY